MNLTTRMAVQDAKSWLPFLAPKFWLPTLNFTSHWQSTGHNFRPCIHLQINPCKWGHMGKWVNTFDQCWMLFLACLYLTKLPCGSKCSPKPTGHIHWGCFAKNALQDNHIQFPAFIHHSASSKNFSNIWKRHQLQCKMINLQHNINNEFSLVQAWYKWLFQVNFFPSSAWILYGKKRKRKPCCVHYARCDILSSFSPETKCRPAK